MKTGVRRCWRYLGCWTSEAIFVWNDEFILIIWVEEVSKLSCCVLIPTSSCCVNLWCCWKHCLSQSMSWRSFGEWWNSKGVWFGVEMYSSGIRWREGSNGTGFRKLLESECSYLRFFLSKFAIRVLLSYLFDLQVEIDFKFLLIVLWIWRLPWRNFPLCEPFWRPFEISLLVSTRWFR